MDELDLLAGARPVDPPSTRTVDEARRRLTRQIYAKRASRWRTRILVPVAAGVLAVSTGIVVGAHVLGSAPPPSRGATDGPGVTDAGPIEADNRSARELLLTAAEQTLNEPDPGSGKFWTSTIEHGSLIRVGRPGNRYAIMGAYTETWWIPVVDPYRVLDRRWAGGEPASDADKAAWKKAGSPSSWPKEPRAGCPVDPKNAYTAAPATASTVTKDTGKGPQIQYRYPSTRPYVPKFWVLGEDLTVDQVRALPSDPAALKAWLIGVIKKQDLPHRTDVELGEAIFNGVMNLLFQNPITPQVRSAAYQVLAGLAGVTSLGAVKDAKGRDGVAVAITTNDTVDEQMADSGGPYQVSLVFNPDSGQTLAEVIRAMKPAAEMAWVPKGAVIGYRVLESTRWTDEEPPAANAPAAVAYGPGEC
ncbi:CU044_5270 family protein [Phytohabitans sp. LJ34]|uniref:CU044_5270 family protein n=1 Tax=Phytohabitans sp. LJ34 TaxID=3452217 RepID=UPI003F8BB2D5